MKRQGMRPRPPMGGHRPRPRPPMGRPSGRRYGGFPRYGGFRRRGCSLGGIIVAVIIILVFLFIGKCW